MDDLSKTILELACIDRQIRANPFPSRGCQRLYSMVGKQAEYLNSNLDLYFADLVGIGSSARKASRWKPDRVQMACKVSRQSFFDKHPECRAIKNKITRAETPDLYSELVLHEDMRIKIRHLLTLTATEPVEAELKLLGQHPVSK